MKHLLSVLAFMFVSFGVQGLSHFLINKEHFASISFMRSDPIFAMGFAAMIIQGLIMSYAVTCLAPSGATLRDGVTVSIVFGLFLAVYIVLAEPAKYAAPSILAWVTVEGIASTVQFVVFGFLLGYIHQRMS